MPPDAPFALAKAAFALAAVPVRYVVEGHRWAQAAALEAQPRSFPWDRFLIGPAMIHFARALGRIHSGDLTGSAREVAELESLRDRLKKEGTGYDWSTVAETLRLEAAGWLANARGRRAEAGELLRRAADLEDSTEKNAVTPGAIVPAREQLAGFLLEAGHPADALREYESALRSAPNRFNGLYGAGRAAENSGQPAKARAYYQSLLAISDPASRRPEVAEAKAFVARPAPAGPTRLP